MHTDLTPLKITNLHTEDSKPSIENQNDGLNLKQLKYLKEIDATNDLNTQSVTKVSNNRSIMGSN